MFNYFSISVVIVIDCDIKWRGQEKREGDSGAAGCPFEAGSGPNLACVSI